MWYGTSPYCIDWKFRESGVFCVERLVSWRVCFDPNLGAFNVHLLSMWIIFWHITPEAENVYPWSAWGSQRALEACNPINPVFTGKGVTCRKKWTKTIETLIELSLCHITRSNGTEEGVSITVLQRIAALWCVLLAVMHALCYVLFAHILS